MLGKTAGGLYWMFRYLERSENTARLVDAGLRIAVTRAASSAEEWASVITTAGVQQGYHEKYDGYSSADVVDYLLRDPDNPSSVRSVIKLARDNARTVRTALTREVWEATNECWMTLKDALQDPIPQRELPDLLALIRTQSAIVRGALHGTMLRNDIYDFARLGTFLERADNTARILDVKYYVLLPSPVFVGTAIDNTQWETVLRSVSADHTYRWLSGGDITAGGIADFLILDRRFPRSLSFCLTKISDNLGYLAEDYGQTHPCHELASALRDRLKVLTIGEILDSGLHQFVLKFISEINGVGYQIEQDYKFTG